jgi:hypothetical protein
MEAAAIFISTDVYGIFFRALEGQLMSCKFFHMPRYILGYDFKFWTKVTLKKGLI